MTAFSGKANGSWSQVPMPFPGDTEDKLLIDLAYGHGRWAACGWDAGAPTGDASPYYSVLFMNAGEGWRVIDVPKCEGCSLIDYRSVGIDQQGKILLGGSMAVPGDDYLKPIFMSYDPVDSSWVSIPLPESELAQRVDDILVTTKGDVYLACAPVGLVHLYPTGEGVIEWSGSAIILSLAEASTGEIYAVGSKPKPGEPYDPILGYTPLPLMLRRPANL